MIGPARPRGGRRLLGEEMGSPNQTIDSTGGIWGIASNSHDAASHSTGSFSRGTPRPGGGTHPEGG